MTETHETAFPSSIHSQLGENLMKSKGLSNQTTVIPLSKAQLLERDKKTTGNKSQGVKLSANASEIELKRENGSLVVIKNATLLLTANTTKSNHSAALNIRKKFRVPEVMISSCALLSTITKIGVIPIYLPKIRGLLLERMLC